MDITRKLPEECIADIISKTSPPDACKMSLVSRTFRSAAASNLVWEALLPPDHQQIISESVSSSSSLNILSMKDLYFSLCDNPILINNGKRSFTIHKWSGKKCYMLGARELGVIWGDASQYWKWYSLAESRVLPKSRSLSPTFYFYINVCEFTQHALYVYLVFVLTINYGLQYKNHVQIFGGRSSCGCVLASCMGLN
ncbi:F-box protein PP2-B1-like [Carya illinoinensis]|uniref:F-box protein PP2-B1-like n=1 Tax=Carya illinoinensis TaxID=32201 RepID=UPI001C71CB4C|nr:F-box protein PP2-B1-like [Carya illinoinensis]